MFLKHESNFHPLEVENQEIPEIFNYPFYYTPNSLCKRASEELQGYLENQQDFQHNFGLGKHQEGLVIGKMFGIMIVQRKNGQYGYIAAFSGKLAESNFVNGFVPPIYDTLDQEGFYKIGEQQLNEYTKQIKLLETKDSYITLQNEYKQAEIDYQEALADYKKFMKAEKVKRKKSREEAKKNLDDLALEQHLSMLEKESIHQHYRLKDLKNHWTEKIEALKTKLSEEQHIIDDKKEQRKTLSNSLQHKLHQQYSFLNAREESKGLSEIFEQTVMKVPPAGSGECAAPKLFQFAYLNDLKPICMAEFWWGASPKSEVRKHKNYYPSCKGKCEPILGHMLEGLQVEENPLLQYNNSVKSIEIIYEDEYLLAVNKPHEFLSVPGKEIKDSVLARIKKMYPDAKGPLLVHRLDMSTSGILLVAKNEYIHKKLQFQFIKRYVNKRYVAILDGELKEDSGLIDLPLIGDFYDRPRQKVCYETGKQAKTRFKVLDRTNQRTRIQFFPITGRTHQLRVHAAHKNGLNMPIKGDDLYGKKADRLYLHAEFIQFEHPISKEKMSIKCPAPF